MRVLAFLFTVFISGSASLQAQQPTSAARLAGTEWKLASFGGAAAEVPVVEGTTVTIKFGVDGRAGGSSGCNSYGGDYRVRGNTISFGRIISTKRACTDPRANQQEQRYFRALGAARSFSVEGDSLTIDTGANGTLNFVKPPEALQPTPEYEDFTNPTALLASYYNAINSSEYERAFSYWQPPPSSLETFARGTLSNLVATGRDRLKR